MWYNNMSAICIIEPAKWSPMLELAYMGRAIKSRLNDAILVAFSVVEVDQTAEIRQ